MYIHTCGAEDVCMYIKKDVYKHACTNTNRMLFFVRNQVV